jgi:hypothetical protein
MSLLIFSSKPNQPDYHQKLFHLFFSSPFEEAENRFQLKKEGKTRGYSKLLMALTMMMMMKDYI